MMAPLQNLGAIGFRGEGRTAPFAAVPMATGASGFVVPLRALTILLRVRKPLLDDPIIWLYLLGGLERGKGLHTHGLQNIPTRYF